MAMKRDRSFFWIVPMSTFDHWDAHSIMDLLRYDSAIIQSNPPAGFYLFKRSGDFGSGPNLERLRSRGVIVEPWQIVQGPDRVYELKERAAARAKVTA